MKNVKTKTNERRAKCQNRLKPAETYTHTHTHTHTCNSLLRKKQIGTICFIFSILIFPTYATINVQPGSTASCDSATLTTSENDVTANLTAQYHANTITFTYDANGGTTSNGGTWTNDAATQCEYDMNFNLPTAPSKTGYNFDGWRAVLQCNISGLDHTATVDYGYGPAYGSSSPGVNTDKYDLVCREWATEYEHGILKGYSICTSTSGSTVGEMQNSVYNGDARYCNNSRGDYCWCRPEYYIDSNGVKCFVSEPRWVFLRRGDSCNYSCPSWCGSLSTSSTWQTLRQVLLQQLN